MPETLGADSDLLRRLAVALAIGLMVGLERGWQSRDEREHQRTAGFRTFALSGLLGGVAAALAQQSDMAVLGVVFLGFAGAFTLFHWQEARAEHNFSVTAVVAGLLTFVLGAYAVLGTLVVAVAAAVAMTVLLALREPLHRWIASLRWEEIRAMLILLAMSFLLLPILPNRPIDPWGSVNPFEIWLMAILIAGISFGGYAAVKIFGDRLGVLMAALAGGLASSTATTLTFARLGRAHPASARLLAAGALLAGIVMVVRVALVASLLNQALIAPLLLPLGLAALVMAAGVGWLLWRAPDGQQHPQLHITNPLELGTAIKLALFIAAVLLAAHFVQSALGHAGVLLLAAASGVADVDAVTISMARLAGGGLDVAIASQAIALTVAVNTSAKAAMAGWVGGVAIGKPVALISAASILAGAVGMIWLGAGP